MSRLAGSTSIFWAICLLQFGFVLFLKAMLLLQLRISQPGTSYGHFGRGTLNWEDLPVGDSVVHFLFSDGMKGPTVNGAPAEQVILGCIRKQLTMCPPWPLHQSLDFLDDRLQAVKWNKLSSPSWSWSWCFTTETETLNLASKSRSFCLSQRSLSLDLHFRFLSIPSFCFSIKNIC